MNKMSPTYEATSRELTKELKNKYIRQIMNSENLFVYNKTSFELDEASLITLNGKLYLNCGLLSEAKRSTVLRLDRNAQINVTGGEFRVCYDGDIVVFSSAVLMVGDSKVGSGCKIRCGKSITIGNGCVIADNVTILDSDFHILVRNGENMPRHGTGIVIEDNVWIGEGVTIMKNVHIGEGAVIEPGALVTKDVPAHSLVGGSPARLKSENIEWKI